MDPQVPTKQHFSDFYERTPPWDIGRPQKPFVNAASEIKGSVLDAGCGTGENAIFFAQQGCQVTGIDFLERPVQKAKEKASQRGVDITFLTHDALALGNLGKQFDNVIDCGLFHVFSDEDRKRYVAQLERVLKPGGKLFLMCFSDKEPGTDGPRRVSANDLRTAFASPWQIESQTETRFEIADNLPPEMHFTPGGPHAWFVKIRRGK